MSSILVVVEEQLGKLNTISWETIIAAEHLAGIKNLPIQIAIPGADTIAVAKELSSHLSHKIIQVEHPLLRQYTPDGFLLALEQLIHQIQPAYILFPHTYQTRDFAPTLATRFNRMLLSGIIAIEPGPLFTRQLYQGRFHGNFLHTVDGPAFLSIQAGTFQPCVTTHLQIPSDIEIFTPSIDIQQIRTKAETPFRSAPQSINLSKAQRVIDVGRGIGNAENISLVQKLAEALGAEIAASRPVCDAGWLPMERLVGSSGQSVSPDLYIAVGVSGAAQHLVGIKNSKCIVAINKDPNAPIFEVADYAIVGDLFEIIPALIEAINNRS